jgi:hypothetical protein
MTYFYPPCRPIGHPEKVAKGASLRATEHRLGWYVPWLSRASEPLKTTKPACTTGARGLRPIALRVGLLPGAVFSAR